MGRETWWTTVHGAAESDATEHNIRTSGKHKHSVHNHIWLVVFNDYILLIPTAVSYYRLQVPFLTLEIELLVPLNIFILDNFLKWKSLSCVRLCNPMDYTVPGILQARTLDSVCHFLSRGSSQPRDQACISCIGRRILNHWATRESPECG